jgi:TATA-box binding protein (TBP) (component of TFIID and TFIIIB)
MSSSFSSVEEHLVRVADDFLCAFDATSDVVTRHIGVHPLSVNTITFLGKLDVGVIDLATVELGMMLYDALRAVEHQPGSGFLLRSEKPGGDTKKRQRRPRKDFHNQLPLVTPAGKAVKLFSNGKIHVTGCTSPIEFLDIAAQLCAFLPIVLAGVDHVSLEWFDIEMINAGFLLCSVDRRRHIRLKPNRLSAELKTAANVTVDFETERHPGVKLVVLDDNGAKAGAVMIFQTGSVQICGVKEPAHLARAYRQACTHIDDIVGKLGEEVCLECDARQLRTTTSKHPFRLVAGYPTSLYNACMGAGMGAGM